MFIRVCVLLSIVIGVLNPVALAADQKLMDGDKVLVVLLHKQSCRTWCKEVRPILEEISKDYGSQIAIHELDITSEEMDKTNKLAKKLGVASFIQAAKDSVPCVGIFTPDRTLVSELPGPQKKKTYKKYIDRAINSKG